MTSRVRWMVAPGGNLHDTERVALVFFGHEAARHAPEQEAAEHHQHGEPGQPPGLVAQAEAHGGQVVALRPVVAAVEPAGRSGSP